MTKVIHTFIYIILLLIPTLCFAGKQTTPRTRSLDSQINQVLKEFGDNINIGILVQDANTGKILYQKNADRYFMPASNQKLLTAYAALMYLPQNFTYQTTLFADLSKVNNGILNDNIYLQFTGDPTLTIEQLDHLIGTLRQIGIKQINGNVVVDDTAFDYVYMSPGTTWDDKIFCWGSPVSAITINHNCVKTTLLPAPQPNQPATLEMLVYPQSMQFINQVITRAPGTANCTLDIQPTNSTTYTISGCTTTADKPKPIEMAVNDPRENIKYVLAYLLYKNQINNNHIIEFRKLNTVPKALVSETSPPLSILVSKMLKDSDNTIAQALFKTIGSLYAKEPGSFKNGHDAVHDILLKTIQLDIPTTTLIDGAGGSRYNYLTPQQISLLLQKIYVSTQAKNFISALAIGGTDGTLKDRMKDPALQGKVFAKTGTETAVTTLSGYLETQKKKTLIFSFMINGFVDMPTKYKALEDRLCTVLSQTS